MYGGERLSERGAGLGRVGGPGDVADQPLVTWAVLAGNHRRLFDAVQPGQGGLDFTGLDAIPADLDLLVGAAHVLQLPVAAPPRQIAGAIHADSGGPKRAGNKPRRGQIGPAEISDAHAAPGDVQLTEHSVRHRL